jgi:hypothetical protein
MLLQPLNATKPINKCGSSLLGKCDDIEVYRLWGPGNEVLNCLH